MKTAEDYLEAPTEEEKQEDSKPFTLDEEYPPLKHDDYSLELYEDDREDEEETDAEVE